MVSIMAKDANIGTLVSSSVHDLRGVSISRVRTTYAREVGDIVRRLVDPGAVPSQPQTANFSSAI